MKELDNIIQFLISSSFPLLSGPESDVLTRVFQELSMQNHRDVLDVISQTPDIPLLIKGNVRSNIIHFLKSLSELEVLLMRWDVEFLALWAEAKTCHPQKLEKHSSADSVIDTLNAFLPHDQNILKKLATVLSLVANFAGISQFASLVANLEIAVAYCLDAIENKNNFPQLMPLQTTMKHLIEVRNLRQQLKTVLEEYRNFHFHYVITKLTALHKKAPEFYFEINAANYSLISGEVTSAEIVKIRKDFLEKKSPYLDDPSLMFHLDAYTVIHDALRLLTFPKMRSDKILTECISILSYKKSALELPAPNVPHTTAWFSFFARPTEQQGELQALCEANKKLFDQLFQLVNRADAYLMQFEPLATDLHNTTSSMKNG